jgi:hypothetical protein
MTLHHWFAYEGTDIFHVGESGAYTYKTGHVALDADGCPRAYHPDNTGLDALANAGFPHGGWRSVLVVDPNHPDKPFVQPQGPTQGFFVSKTSLTDQSLPETDPDKYVDAASVPYIVFPGAFHALAGTGTWGDVLMARSLNAANAGSAAIVADQGPTNAPLGEISLKLAEALGGHNPNPRNGAGAPHGPFQYVVFPKSKGTPPWRRTVQDIQTQAAALLAEIGGWPTL